MITAKRTPRLLDGTRIRREIQRSLCVSAKHAQVHLPATLFDMMAFDRTPTPRLETETLDSLRAVMDRALRRGNHANELQDVLTRAAAEARTKAIPPEQLLIIMKDLWHSLPEIRATDTERQTELLQELISRCIEHYYDK